MTADAPLDRSPRLNTLALLALGGALLAACATTPTTAPPNPHPVDTAQHTADDSPTRDEAPTAPSPPPAFDPAGSGIPLSIDDEANLRYALVQALIDQHAYAQALEHIGWLRLHRASWWTVQLQFAEAHYLVTADGTEALAALRNALALKPINPRALMLMGQIYEDQGNTQKAEFAYRQVLQWRPDDNPAQLRLARLRHRAGDLAEARQLYEGLLLKVDNDILALTELAVILEKQGNLTEAEARFKKVLKLHPDRFTGYKYLILFYQRTGQLQAAEDTTHELEQFLDRHKPKRHRPRRP